jgi:hypothetical protein
MAFWRQDYPGQCFVTQLLIPVSALISELESDGVWNFHVTCGHQKRTIFKSILREFWQMTNKEIYQFFRVDRIYSMYAKTLFICW